MIPCVFHSMTPCHSTIVEDEFSSDLEVVTALEGAGTGFEALVYCANHGGRKRVLHILGGFWTQTEGANHAQLRVQLLRGVGVDGVRALGFPCVHGNEFGLPAADDVDVHWWRQRLKHLRCDGGAEAA